MNPETNNQPLPPAPCSAAVIAVEGYYRVKGQNEMLIRIVDDLYRLVGAHHSSVVMRGDLAICPECTKETCKRILDRAWEALRLQTPSAVTLNTTDTKTKHLTWPPKTACAPLPAQS